MPGSNHVSEETEAHLPKSHWPLPELSTVGPEHEVPAPLTFTEAQQSEEFAKLRSTFRNFAFPTVIAVLVVYFTYVLLSSYAKDLMNVPWIGNLNSGMVFGLIQFPLVWFATWLYVRRANNVLDPIAKSLRDKIEGEATK